jgi:hypothetical protein
MSVFDDLGVPRKFAMPYYLKLQTCEKLSLGSRDTAPRTKATRVFFHARGPFSDRDSGQTEEALGDPRVSRYGCTCPIS